eukprot:CAMPEP_0117551818 /NCGR_PEP_ID=MMETSP0784-20121206/49385_1 /TAXON_ID=39447 /ORGANISM="" /LENGTH=51 /DNA_ID=CAMNT_0005348865 /DNA_START=125 /DNA_END=276 /DNA_ORIENTATION=+
MKSCCAGPITTLHGRLLVDFMLAASELGLAAAAHFDFTASYISAKSSAWVL